MAHAVGHGQAFVGSEVDSVMHLSGYQQQVECLREHMRENPEVWRVRYRQCGGARVPYVQAHEEGLTGSIKDVVSLIRSRKHAASGAP